MRELAFGGFISLGVEQDRAELERGVVGDAVAPVLGEAAGGGVFEIAFDDEPEGSNFFRTCLAFLQPAGGELGTLRGARRGVVPASLCGQACHLSSTPCL